MRLLALIRAMLSLRLLSALAALLIPAAAIAEPGDVQTAWRLLDYMAVDYGGAVANGRIKSTSEYAEMTEFAASVSTRLQGLPAKPERQALIQRAANLQAVIAEKGPTEQVATLAHGLAADLLRAYPVPLAPDKAPNLVSSDALFRQSCASCHGMTGNGRGPDAAKLATPPIAFTDAERARQRSVFALYQVVTQGIDGTAMQSFADLPNDQRWALAFRAGSFAFTDAQAREGERLWKSDPTLRRRIPDLKTLVALTPAALGAAIGDAKVVCSKEALAWTLREIGWPQVGNLIGLAAGLALPSVILMMMFGQTRIFFVMSRDGLLPSAFSRVHPKYKTPHVVTIMTGVFVSIFAALFPVGALADISNSGTLFAFAAVSIAVLVLRRTDPDRKRPFRTPAVMLVAPIAAAGCVYLFFSLSFYTVSLFFGWAFVGLIVYFSYGYRKSNLGRGIIETHETDADVPPQPVPPID